MHFVRHSSTEKRIRIQVLNLCEQLYYLPSDISLAPSTKLKLKVSAPFEVAAHLAQETALKKAEEESLIKSYSALSSEHPTLASPALATPTILPETVLEPVEPINYEELNKTGFYIISKLKQHESAAPFLTPVDEILYPHYRKIVKYPMDLETIAENLKTGVYGDKLAVLFVDVRQIFKNCYLFNLDTSAIYQHAKRLEHYFEKELLPEAVPEMAAVIPKQSAPAEPKAPVIPITIPKLTKLVVKKSKESTLPSKGFGANEYQACKRILGKLFTHKSGIWFQRPVIYL